MSGKWKKVVGASLLMLTLFLIGCKSDTVDEQKISDLDYTVTSEDRLPEELKLLIEEKKPQPFKLTYQDGEYLYICQGFGQQPTGGYSIQVKHVYETANAIYFGVNLIGPAETEPKTEKGTAPYIVIKIEYREKAVVFD